MKNLLSVVLAVALCVGVYVAFRTGLVEQLSDYDQLVETLRNSGVRGPLICVAIQFVQVVIFAIPGEVTQIAAGYVFGAWGGFFYSWVGIMAGAACAFAFSRVVGRPVVRKIIGEERLTRIDRTLESDKGKSTLFLLFLIPGMPKDSMSFAAGVTDLAMGEFIVLSGLGRAPALLFSTMIGDQLYERDYSSIAITVVVGALAAGLFYLYEKRRKRSWSD